MDRTRSEHGSDCMRRLAFTTIGLESTDDLCVDMGINPNVSTSSSSRCNVPGVLRTSSAFGVSDVMMLRS